MAEDSSNELAGQSKLRQPDARQLELSLSVKSAKVLSFPVSVPSTQRSACSSDEVSKRLLEFASRLPDW